LQASAQALFHAGGLAFFHACSMACLPVGVHARQKDYMLYRLPACLLGWFLASMPSSCRAGPMAVHRANMQASQQNGKAAGGPSIMPAFRLCRWLAGTDFHREKRPKHCLGEKCDKNYCLP
jgi:hypothetical protein